MTLRRSKFLLFAHKKYPACMGPDIFMLGKRKNVK